MSGCTKNNVICPTPTQHYLIKPTNIPVHLLPSVLNPLLHEQLYPPGKSVQMWSQPPLLVSHSLTSDSMCVATKKAVNFLPSSQEGPVNPGEQSQYPVLRLHTPFAPQGGWHISAVERKYNDQKSSINVCVNLLNSLRQSILHSTGRLQDICTVHSHTLDYRSLWIALHTCSNVHHCLVMTYSHHLLWTLWQSSFVWCI